MKIQVSMQFRVGGTADLDAQTDALMDELVDIEERLSTICDPSVAGSLTKRLIEVSVVVDAGTVEDALGLGREFIRQAVVAAGGHIGDPGRDPESFQIEGSRQLVLA